MAKYQSKRTPLDLQDRGPTIVVDVGVPPVRILGPGGQPQRHKTAIIDPASALSVVDQSILDALKLTPSIVDLASTHHGTVETGVYGVSLTLHFDLPFFIPLVQVVAGQMRDCPHKVVLGRNVLKSGTFLYNGREGTWELDFSESWATDAATWT